jgi:hypothetical protein
MREASRSPFCGVAEPAPVQRSRKTVTTASASAS